jgi:hypothetical protein
MWPGVDDTAGQKKQNGLNLKCKERGIGLTPVFREKFREFLWIAEILLKEAGDFKLCDIFKSADCPSFAMVTRDRKEIAYIDRTTP